MTEDQYQTEFLNFISARTSNSVFVPKFPMKYDIGKYHQGKVVGMPDTVFDIVELDENNNFHLWELKLISSNELWTGKFFGQFILYNFLFETEPWNELFGRFLMKANTNNHGIKGNIERITSYILSLTNDDNTEYADDSNEEVIGDSVANFSTWRLLVCGGSGYELAAGFNPIIWHYLVLSKHYFKEEVPKLEIYHFYKTDKGYEFRDLVDVSIYAEKGLTLYAWDRFREEIPAWRELIQADEEE